MPHSAQGPDAGSKNRVIGYIRVSSLDQNTERQLDGLALDKRFEDKASGKDTHRPQLKAALDYLRDGDVLVVHSIDRLARSLADTGHLRPHILYTSALWLQPTIDHHRLYLPGYHPVLAATFRLLGYSAFTALLPSLLGYPIGALATFLLALRLSQRSRAAAWGAALLWLSFPPLLLFALSAMGRVPAMLNFTSGLAGLKSALRTAKVKRVITAHRLVEKAGLQDVIAGLGAEIVYLEDVRKNLSLRNKLAAVTGKTSYLLIGADPGEDKRKAATKHGVPILDEAAFEQLLRGGA